MCKTDNYLSGMWNEVQPFENDLEHGQLKPSAHMGILMVNFGFK